jgi:hypothetical protein
MLNPQGQSKAKQGKASKASKARQGKINIEKLKPIHSSSNYNTTAIT